MHKLSIPIHLNTITPESIPQYLDMAQKCRAKRIFFCGFDFLSENCAIQTMPDTIRDVFRTFRENGYEVGAWIGGFGHGAPLSHQVDAKSNPFTQIEGINGEIGRFADCPRDPNFVAAYGEKLRRLAQFGPDLIMIDDDFRINGREGYYFGCFCPRHLREYYKRLGEEPPREKLEALILTGGKNKYRTEYLNLARDTLIGFAKEMRRIVDSVNPNIRMGCSSTNEHWVLCGTDAIELARAFAGSTAPFTRSAGAPYWRDNIIPVIEATRQQFAWGKDTGVEMFSEGDTYPRPRYNIPSKTLELFDHILMADGTGDGQLAYLFDYSYRPDYETGYVDRYIRNAPLRDGIRDLFKDKTPVGVQVFNISRKAENWELPETLTSQHLANKLLHAIVPPSRTLLAQNSIPTAFEACGYPLLLIGENARYVEREQLKNGAILDIRAAKILKARGIDTGLISAKPGHYNLEYYVAADEQIVGVETYGLQKIVCHENAETFSYFRPENDVASYAYENKEGERFFVLAYDHFSSIEGANYMKNYHRQADLIRAIRWLSGKKLPAVTLKNPNVYLLASTSETAMSVALANVHLDDVYDAKIHLDKCYSHIRFLNCEGHLEGDTVQISHIPPYGFAAFEVTE